MQVILLKDYKPHSRVLKKGTEMGVTNSKGLELIEKGIARDVTKEYKQEILFKRNEKEEEIKKEVEALEIDIDAEQKKSKKKKKNS